MIIDILIVLLILGAIGGAPRWGYWGANGAPYGWGPSGILGTLLVIAIIIAILRPSYL